MKIGIMQPYFMPYIGYYQLIKYVDKYVIYDDVNFIKKGWINRNNLIIGSEKKMFSISLKDVSQNKLINEIEIIHDFSKLLKTIEFNYKKAPYFYPVFELINSITNFQNRKLDQFLFNSIKETLYYLDIKTELLLASTIEKNNNLKGEDKIIDICKKLKADTYINHIGGLDLYSQDKFFSNNLSLHFLQTNLIEYKQFTIGFIPALSIIDIMMFNTPEEINEMLDNFVLI